ncbi:hypothetical protein A2865_02810 [Candidatus Woesebacteria bacterium RIFCSPHIGHO2_01_FULL_39_17]|uniref:Uncharacterized protein n=2 Tax=Candidatus Woeseibacteriota TaxID=1752722 RepID=A0A0G0PV77_9BACT|nr:MAG: hypothetical protein US72_C0016G0006 [Microgenomates group bacterium GW2011_GWC1_38_12]KKQ93201.1 MAG: hypothetical protein UT19_C0016G0014 [Candidatus Woesebacteria bacterium GW2011_GWB1_39_10b]OGM23689.1 MAG: hypothetical protein A2865_02810 [Candidatus Woesebacteria bacterium RIFCSPHIGHO2_01_FULL_39_17]OGM61146.1 MAG: hypothetical protein A3A52_00510 [Candidatus Woesebacteria bacterium RIFCSPLOWO2_01_FULL_39_14]
MYEVFIDRIKTNEDKERLLEEIEVLLTGIYEDKGYALDSLLQTGVRSWVSSYIREEFSKSGVNRESFLRGLEKELRGLKDVYLTIAFEPTQDQIDTMASFLKQEIGSSIILNLSYDPQIIGGVQIIYEGLFRDFSFNRIFEKEFEEDREEILKKLAQNE